MSEYPHVPAAFINAIAEEGTKAEAVRYLQQQWNETCALRAANRIMLEALQGTLTVIEVVSAKQPPDMMRGFAVWREQITRAITQASAVP